MSAAAENLRDSRGELLTMKAALAILPCSRSVALRLLKAHLEPATGLSLGGRLEWRLISPRSWLVYRHSAEAAARTFRWDAGQPKGTRKPGGTRQPIRRRR